MLKRMKNWAPLVFAALALMLSSCGDSSSSTNSGLLLSLMNQSPTSTVTISKFQDGEVVRNEVIATDGETYWEYFKFTDDTTGEYKLYKKVGETKEVLTTDPKDGSTLPTTFTYDQTTGGFTVGNSTSYLFDAPKDGLPVNVLASELMTTTEKKRFSSTWSCSDGDFTFSVDSSNLVSWKMTQSENSNSYPYTKEGGWVTITVESIPFYWDGVSKFYYLAYETERTIVEDFGRGLNDADVNLTSPVFIYKNLNK